MVPHAPRTLVGRPRPRTGLNETRRKSCVILELVVFAEELAPHFARNEMKFSQLLFLNLQDSKVPCLRPSNLPWSNLRLRLHTCGARAGRGRGEDASSGKEANLLQTVRPPRTRAAADSLPHATPDSASTRKERPR